MPNYAYRSVQGNCDYALRRRSDSWHYDFWHKAKRYRESTKTNDVRQARIIAERDIARVLNAGPVTWTIKQLCDAYLESRWPDDEHRVNNRTYHDAKSRLEMFSAAHGERDVPALAGEMTTLVRQWIDSRAASVKPLTLRNDARVISAALSWLAARGLTPWESNPATTKRLRMSPVHVSPKLPPTVADVDKLLRVAKRTPIFPALVLMLSGLRPIGVSRVLWSQVHFERKILETGAEKNRTRTIPLSEWAVKNLKRWRKNHPGENVYPYHESVMFRDLKTLRERHGLPDSLTWQSIRRLSYQRLYAAGTAPQLAAKIMGSSIRVAMQHYVDLSVLDARAAAAALAPDAKPSQKPSQKKKRRKPRR